MLRTVNIRDDVHTKLRLEAFDQKKSLQGLVDEILRDHMKKDTKNYDVGQ